VTRPFAAAALLSLAALPQVYAQPAGTIPVPDGGVNSDGDLLVNRMEGYHEATKKQVYREVQECRS